MDRPQSVECRGITVIDKFVKLWRSWCMVLWHHWAEQFEDKLLNYVHVRRLHEPTVYRYCVYISLD
jgi:hypothetical protein